MFFLLGYLLISVSCFFMIRYYNSIETNEREIVSFGWACFASLLPFANLISLFIFTYGIFKTKTTIGQKLNNWFTHGKQKNFY